MLTFIQIVYNIRSYDFHFSTNHLECCAALSAVCKIVNEDMIPVIIKDVSTHEDVVRVQQYFFFPFKSVYML